MVALTTFNFASCNICYNILVLHPLNTNHENTWYNNNSIHWWCCSIHYNNDGTLMVKIIIHIWLVWIFSFLSGRWSLVFHFNSFVLCRFISPYVMLWEELLNACFMALSPQDGHPCVRIKLLQWQRKNTRKSIATVTIVNCFPPLSFQNHRLPWQRTQTPNICWYVIW